MSTIGIRNFRPKIHFTPIKGWTNDPNGLVYYNNKYHLFYQHYPYTPVWGPMHWGHAISEDLINWEHLPIALEPDMDGTAMFSGSAAIDVNNISGFSRDGKTPLIAIYTAHGDEEAQSIAYSLDGINFVKYDENPVIPNPGLRDFRDPKMFWNPVKNCWSLVLAASDRVHFYETDDFKSWKKTGEFGTKEDGNHASGIWECTDLIPLEHKGKTIWLLIGSMTWDGKTPFIGTQYFLGDFDGDKFINTMPFDQPERVDCGWDNYAGVTFNNLARENHPVFIGWGTCPHYAKRTPTGVYCGNMTLPRRLFLVETALGLRLGSAPVAVDRMIDGGKVLESNASIPSETYVLKIEGKGSACISLRNDKGQEYVFGVDDENCLYADRSNAGTKSFHKLFASPEFSTAKAKRFYDGSYTMYFYFDVSITELYIDNGTRNMTMLCYPDAPYNNIVTNGDVEVTLFRCMM